MRGAWADWRTAKWLRWSAGVLLVLLLALVFWRESISERLVPDPRMNRQLELAQAALEAGRLTATDGSGARELFESVLATDPDQMVARRGLMDVRDAAIARAQLALQQRRLAQARDSLALAEALSAPAVQMQPLQLRLRDLQEASSNVSGLLAQAADPEVSDQQALELFNQVLLLDADNALAIEGRRELLAGWLLQAETMIAEDKPDQAQALVLKVIADDPAHLDLPPVQAMLGEALARHAASRARTLASAQADERSGRLDRAAQAYLRLQADGDPDPAVSEGLQRLAARMARQAQRQAADFQFTRAEASLAKARRWYRQAPGIASAERALAQSRQARKRLGSKPARAELERIPALVAEAGQAMDRGEFITPPGGSAWDKLRVAAAIDDDAPQVIALRREFARRSAACFDAAMTANQLRRAQSCLEAGIALDPATEFSRQARRRLADRWIARAEERIGASDYDQAEQALAQARRWQPGHARLAATTLRLQRARGPQR